MADVKKFKSLQDLQENGNIYASDELKLEILREKLFGASSQKYLVRTKDILKWEVNLI